MPLQQRESGTVIDPTDGHYGCTGPKRNGYQSVLPWILPIKGCRGALSTTHRLGAHSLLMILLSLWVRVTMFLITMTIIEQAEL